MLKRLKCLESNGVKVSTSERCSKKGGRKVTVSPWVKGYCACNEQAVYAQSC